MKVMKYIFMIVFFASLLVCMGAGGCDVDDDQSFNPTALPEFIKVPPSEFIKLDNGVYQDISATLTPRPTSVRVVPPSTFIKQENGIYLEVPLTRVP